MGLKGYTKFLCLGALTFLVSACLPDNSSTISDSNATSMSATALEEQELQTVQTTFVSASQSLQSQIIQNAAFAAGNANVGQLDFAAMNITNIPSNMGGAYCEIMNIDGSVTGQIVTWTSDISTSGTSQQNDYALLTASNNRVDLQTGGGMQSINFGNDCNGLQIPDGSTVMVSESVMPNTDNNLNIQYEYASQPCPVGQVGNITNRRAVSYGSETTNTYNEYGEWELYQNTCMDFVDQSDVGQIAIEVFSNELPGISQGPGQAGELEIAEILSNLDDIECIGASTFNTRTGVGNAGEPASAQNSNSLLDNCQTATTVQPAELMADGSDLMLTSRVVGGETILEECPVGDLTPFTGFAFGYAGQVTILAGWAGDIEFRRDHNEVIDMEDDGTMDDGLSQRQVWEGGNLYCSRDERLRVACAVVNPQFNAPQYTVNTDVGYDFERLNEINGWADPAALVANPSLPNDIGWTEIGADCSWVETESFDNCPAGYTAVTTGEQERDIVANNISAAPDVRSWTSVTASVCERVEVISDSTGCTAGETGSIDTTTTFTSTAPLVSSAPTITTTSTSVNNCVPVIITSACGPAGSRSYPSFPTSSLCNSSTSANKRTISTARGNVFQWDCLDAGGFVLAGCSADEDVAAPTIGTPIPNTTGSRKDSDGRGNDNSSEYADIDGDGDGDMSIGAAINAGYSGFDVVESWNGNDNNNRESNNDGGNSFGDAVSNAFESIGDAFDSAFGIGSGNDSDGDGDRDRVLCGYFYDKGVIPMDMYAADLNFSSKHIDHTLKKGYWVWAVPLVDYMEKNPNSLMEKIAQPIVLGWSREMAYREGAYHKSDITGQFLLNVVAPFVRTVGYFVSETDYTNLRSYQRVKEDDALQSRIIELWERDHMFKYEDRAPLLSAGEGPEEHEPSHALYVSSYAILNNRQTVISR